MNFSVSSYHCWYFPWNYSKLTNKLKKPLHLVGCLHLVVLPPVSICKKLALYISIQFWHIADLILRITFGRPKCA